MGGSSGEACQQYVVVGLLSFRPLTAAAEAGEGACQQCAAVGLLPFKHLSMQPSLCTLLLRPACPTHLCGWYQWMPGRCSFRMLQLKSSEAGASLGFFLAGTLMKMLSWPA